MTIFSSSIPFITVPILRPRRPVTRMGGLVPKRGWIAVVLSACVTSPLTAQATPQDSVGVWLSVIEIMLDTLVTDRLEARRLWIRGTFSVVAETRTARRVPPTPEQLATIRSRFPTAAAPASYDSLFLCPPGVQVRMPGVGCPILDDGLIIEVGPMEFAADSALANGTLVQSSTRHGRTSTWGQGVRLLLRRSTDGWRLVRILGHWIT